jgi:RimJ/RimL family protein N-acetyltransferase
VRSPRVEDRLELAELMMDAYVGTIDYDGETLEQAIAEIDGYLAGEAYLDTSRLAAGNDGIVSAVLMSRLAGVPLVGYVMTRANQKNRGLGSALLDLAIAAVWAAGYGEVRAFITAGNGPSEFIFRRAGFTVIATYDD